MLARVVGTVVVVPLGLLALAPGSGVRAEPYLAVRTGLKCAQCHVNRTGGGGRNDFGSAWAQTQLPMRPAAVRRRALNDWVSLGLDLRALVSGSLTESTPRTAVEMSEAQIQLEARLIPNLLALYVDQTLGPDRAVAREVFGLVERLPLNGYAKAGKFLLPYGWRLWDDEAVIRAETGFTYQTPDLGLEVGIEPGPLSWSLAVSNGSVGAAEGDDQKMITSSAVVTLPRFRVGASASRNGAPGSHRDVVGGFGGFRLGPLAVLGEADWILESFDAQADRDQFVAFVEGDWLVRRGLNAKLSYGYHDPNLDIVEDQRVRVRAGLEVFPISFLQLSAFFIRLDNAGDATDQDRATFEVHLHF